MSYSFARFLTIFQQKAEFVRMLHNLSGLKMEMLHGKQKNSS